MHDQTRGVQLDKQLHRVTVRNECACSTFTCTDVYLEYTALARYTVCLDEAGVWKCSCLWCHCVMKAAMTYSYLVIQPRLQMVQHNRFMVF
jgi:hypothetical protein